MTRQRNTLSNLLPALLGLLTLCGGSLGGFHLLDNADEDLPLAAVTRAAGAAARSATGQAPGPVAGAVKKALGAAAAVTGAPAPVEEGAPDWVRSAPKRDHGAAATAASDQGRATCECICEENESFGEKAMRWLPFLGFLPGVGA